MILKDEDSDAAAIVDRANRQLAEYQRIRRWLVWPDEDFPRTSTQKPRRAEIAAAAQRMLAKDSAATAPGSGLAELISRIPGRTLQNYSNSARLESDLSMSSLDRVECSRAIEDRYQVDLGEIRFSR